ncbi:MAG TPA: CHRD domain-containing protein [Caulobacteraceae bacterium]
MRAAVLAVIAFAAAMAAGCASAETLRYAVALTGAAETPPKPGMGAGAADVALDTETKTLSWTVRYANLSGPATMAHFHGPAPAGVSAGALVPLTGDLKSPISGSATLTDPQIGDLRAGMLYLNIHTAMNPGGEIRGQVVAAH